MFGHVSLCMYVCMYMWTKNRLFGVSPPENLLLVQSTACSLSLMAKKGAYYAWRFVLGKKFGTILITGRKKGPGKLYYGNTRLVYMQCSYTMLIRMQNTNIQPQLCRPTISLQVQSVLTVLRAHRVRVLWNSSLGKKFNQPQH